MIVRFITPNQTANNAKLTVHKTGKLGFSKGAMELLNTNENRFARFGFDEEENLLMEISHTEKENSFHINKAGNYDYMNAKHLLEELGIDYTAAHTTIFDIRKTPEKHVYKLTERIIKK